VSHHPGVLGYLNPAVSELLAQPALLTRQLSVQANHVFEVVVPSLSEHVASVPKPSEALD
jgi:hypothetical protein